MKHFRMPSAYTILFALLILVALATRFVPAGSYDHHDDGTPIAGSYHRVEQNPQGLGDVVIASFRGFYDAVDVALFILMVGGFLGVMMKTGAIDAGVSYVIGRLGGRERLLIPINMRDGSLICTGRGNEDWNCSAPHGAGRLMSRSEAKQSFTVNEFKKQMQGIYTTSVGQATLDECPMAYKSMADIVSNIGPTAEIERIIKPIYNFKAGNGDN